MDLDRLNIDPPPIWYAMQETGHFTIKDLIFQGNQDPDKNAIESPGYQPLTYRDLRQQILYVVKTLNGLGFHRNDRIAVIMPAGPETAVVIISVMAGFTAVPLNPQNREQEYEGCFSQFRIKAIIVQKGYTTAATIAAQERAIPLIELLPVGQKAGIFELNPKAEQHPKEAKFATPHDISHIFLTSGTTASPKIVPVSQKQSYISRQRNFRPSQISQTDRCLHIVPYYHAAGIGAPLLSILLAGGTVICTKEFIPSDFPHLLKTYRPTLYSAGPALHRGILREMKKVYHDPLKDHSLRFIRSGSAALPPALQDELETFFGIPVLDTYASSETGPITVNFPPKRGSAGIPVIENIKIMPDNQERTGPFVHGEIAVRGETVFSGYEHDPEGTKAAFSDGWFRTGDIGYLDDEGYVFITGRKKELINKGGEKISPAEIDHVLMTHPGVKQAMAFRIDDPALGEDIAAMVVMENSDTREEDLRTYLLKRLVHFKVPRRIYVVDDIPRSPTGKYLRYIGTERYAAGEFEDSPALVQTSGTNPPELTKNQEKILQIWKEILQIPSVAPDDDFFHCGGNSLSAVELLIRLHRTFEVALPPDTVYLYPTIRKQADMLARKSGTGKNYHPLIVPIREQGSLPPLICIHSVGGWIGTYQNIFRYFHQDRAVFGIRARGLEPGEQTPQTITEAVREYADAVKTVQKTGPYHLLGYSAGAIYAFELACQLQSRGESVIYLGNIDQSVPRRRFASTVNYVFLQSKGADTLMETGLCVYRRFHDRLKIGRDGILHTFFMKGMRAFSHRVAYLSGFSLNNDWISDYPEKQQPLIRTIRRALQNYQPRTFSGNLTLFSTRPDLKSYPGDPTRGWGEFIEGKTRIIEIPGDHDNLYLDPYAHVVAQKIEESLKAG